jgi:hypothetical protein
LAGEESRKIARRLEAAKGGQGAIHQLARKVGLVTALNKRLSLLKRRRPYSEADHVLTIAYNLMCGGAVLDDIEVRRKTRRSSTPSARADGRRQRRPRLGLATTAA